MLPFDLPVWFAFFVVVVKVRLSPIMLWKWREVVCNKSVLWHRNIENWKWQGRKAIKFNDFSDFLGKFGEKKCIKTIILYIVIVRHFAFVAERFESLYDKMYSCRCSVEVRRYFSNFEHVSIIIELETSCRKRIVVEMSNKIYMYMKRLVVGNIYGG